MYGLAVIDAFDKEAMGRKKDLAETQQWEFQQWEKWKAKGKRPNDLKPLLDSFKPLIRGRANRWANNVDLPPAAVHAEFQKQFVKALDTYNPDKGAALGSWVTTNLQKAQRWVTTYQNPARIQENRHYKVGLYENAKATLDQSLGREPTINELAEHMGWAPAEIGRMQSEIRRALPSSGFAEGYDPTQVMPDWDAERLRLVKYNLNPQEQLVYEYTLGEGGKQQLRPSEIARKLKMSPSKVTRIRQRIAEELEKYK